MKVPETVLISLQGVKYFACSSNWITTSSQAEFRNQGREKAYPRMQAHGGSEIRCRENDVTRLKDRWLLIETYSLIPAARAVNPTPTLRHTQAAGAQRCRNIAIRLYIYHHSIRSNTNAQTWQFPSREPQFPQTSRPLIHLKHITFTDKVQCH